jgi:hypothetical protein
MAKVLCLQQELKKAGWGWEVGFADLDRSTPGSRRSLTMTICGAAILRRAAYEIADIARDREGKTLPRMDADQDKKWRDHLNRGRQDTSNLHSVTNGTSRAICRSNGRQDTEDYEV